MTASWAFVPSAPLLIVADQDVLHEARSAALLVVEQSLAGASGVTVLAPDGTTVAEDETAGGTLDDFGLPLRAGGARRVLGLGHTIGAWLLDRVGWAGPRRYVTRLDAAATDPVVVVADGPGCVDASSPRGYDPRGPQLYDTILAALRAGDPDPLARLDLAAAEELWCPGAPALRMVGRAAQGTRWQAEVPYAGAPLGVGAWAALWR